MTTLVYKGSFATNKRRATEKYAQQYPRARLKNDRVNLTFRAGPCGLKMGPTHERAGLV